MVGWPCFGGRTGHGAQSEIFFFIIYKINIKVNTPIKSLKLTHLQRA